MPRSILHILTPLKHMSPFDVNMAVDAGFQVISKYTQVAPEETIPLVQDSIFSRAPQDGVRTAIFIAGKNAEVALDMMDAAKRAFVPPFENHVFADPAGAFTTGAAMVAEVRRALVNHYGAKLDGQRITIFGGGGVVAYVAAVISAQEGAHPTLVGHDGAEGVAAIAARMRERFSVEVGAADGSCVAARRAAIMDATVILSAGPAGVPILSAEDLACAPDVMVASDVNAVPPAGIHGIDVHARCSPLPTGRGLAIGALAVGNTKYQTQSRLFRRMLQANRPLSLDFRHAYEVAVDVAA